jgi:hypothetical protein
LLHGPYKILNSRGSLILHRSFTSGITGDKGKVKRQEIIFGFIHTGTYQRPGMDNALEITF